MAMSANNETLIENISIFSSTLSKQQLDSFIDIVDKFNELMVMANEDTEKAYQLYLKSLQANISNNNDVTTRQHLAAMANTERHKNDNIVPLKH